MILEILGILALSTLSGYLYHLGGINVNDRPKWLSWKPRDFGCSVLVLLSMLMLGITGPWWVWVSVFGLTWAGLSTYYDDVFFNPIKPKDNHWLHGWFIGIALIVSAIFYGGWIPLLVRGFISAVAMGLWSLYTPQIGNINKARIEEFGRGFIVQAAMLSYLI